MKMFVFETSDRRRRQVVVKCCAQKTGFYEVFAATSRLGLFFLTPNQFVRAPVRREMAIFQIRFARQRPSAVENG
jgi:hypothetical protein